MWPDLVSNPGPLTYDSGALSTAPRGPAISYRDPTRTKVEVAEVFKAVTYCVLSASDQSGPGCSKLTMSLVNLF